MTKSIGRKQTRQFGCIDVPSSLPMMGIMDLRDLLSKINHGLQFDTAPVVIEGGTRAIIADKKITLTGMDVLHLAAIAECALGVRCVLEGGLDRQREQASSASEVQLKRFFWEDLDARLQELQCALWKDNLDLEQFRVHPRKGETNG